ncbi:alpha/beta hydrolase [Lichenihabitans sp. PAMC28606]|uniref:alpha/beta fold hydrolase n=1 Tax=Lichenihabitans sp. PAMC28606 TaxID=2880932 RepID=UPI001D0A3A5E|nr:alpha/beta hydrolase [Lichenihabitans sp. PAMC28606]UDL94398.1 alpha/beta hydrolase [Lichenihabitans sp. PAMC28606]
MSRDTVSSLPPIPGVRERRLVGVNGLSVRILEAGYETPGRPAVLLLHGFPEMAYSWRKVMGPLALAGYHVIAPDQRGYGGTTGWNEADTASFRTHAYARDALGIVSALGLSSVAAVVGHDFGSMIAAYCTLVRPDVFRSLVMISFPFDGPPTIPFDTADAPRPPTPVSLDAQLAALSPPRRDSMAFFASPEANADMLHAPPGLHAFLRAYYHVKSADYAGNHPHPLSTGSAAELATLPTYYIMDRGVGMAATVAPDMPSPAAIAANLWLSKADLEVYAHTYARTGFQGGLNWFRCHTGDIGRTEIELFAGRTIDVPAGFISGTADWGTYRKPGALERMRTKTCTRMKGVQLIEGAGHWTQQEQPDSFNAVLLDMLT